MMNGGPSGFHNAPITRSFVITSGVLTVVFRILGRSNNLGLSYQVFAEKHRFSRIIGSVFAFSSTPELMFGLYLLYYFRIFERQIGSNKYSVFILFSLITSSFFEILGLTLFRDYGLSILASGPYALIFASFVNFYFNVPVLSRFHIFGVRFSDKSFIYLAGLQLLLSSWKRSLIPAICGVLAGFLYNLNAFGINRLKFPGVITSFFSRFSWFTGNSSHLSASRNRIRHIPYAGHRAERAYPPSARRAPIPVQEPPESSVATLVSMGFDGDASRQALMRAGNDINLATNILLQAHSH